MDDQFWLPFFSEHDADLLIPDFPDSWIPEITWTKPEIAESEARVVVATVLPLPQPPNQLSQLSQFPQFPQISQLSQISLSLDERLETAAKRARECISFATADECKKLQMGLEMFDSRRMQKAANGARNVCQPCEHSNRTKFH